MLDGWEFGMMAPSLRLDLIKICSRYCNSTFPHSMLPKVVLYKVVDIASGHKFLIEPTQLKQLDSKFKAEENRFAFNDGDTWLEVNLIDNNAIGTAKVR